MFFFFESMRPNLFLFFFLSLHEYIFFSLVVSSLDGLPVLVVERQRGLLHLLVGEPEADVPAD